MYHNAGYSKATKSGLPWELKYFEEYNDRSDAVKRESQLKKMKSREYILKLISEERPDVNRGGQRFDPA